MLTPPLSPPPPASPTTSGTAAAPPGEAVGAARWPRAELAFLLLMWAYLSRILVLRWLYPYLFFKVTARDLVKATGVELAYMVFSSTLAVAVWVLLLALALDRLPALSRRLLVPLAVASVALVAAVEIDMTWFSMSHRHVSWQQVLPGVQEVGGGQWGITAADLKRYGVTVSKQTVLIGALAGLAWYAWRVSRWIPVRVGPRVIALAVIPLLAVDTAVVGQRLASGNKQWALLISANPFRLTFADRMWERFFRSRQANRLDLEAANRALQQARARPPVPLEARTPRAADLDERRLDVLMVVAESFNASLCDASSMPALFRLAESSFRFRDHYSTGNFSEAGQLSLLYGAPPTFYRGSKVSDVPGSAYVDLFNAKGYRTVAIGHNLRNWRNVDTYLANLNQPIVELDADWDLVPALRAEWQKPGPRFVALFYYGTHFPFEHQARFHAFQPETPDGFDYFSAHLREHKAEVVNRYRNALRELDAWLQAVLEVVDLDKTIVVVTGDHGEELFENGILGHASDLDAPQIRTPLLVRVPGQGRREIDHATSHADVLPTVVRLLGWQVPPGVMAGSLLEGGSDARALVADTNYPYPPHRWAVIAGGRKSVLERANGGAALQIVGLYDESDRPSSFGDDPPAWKENFRQIGALEDAISRSERHEGGRPGGDARAAK